MNLEQSNLNSFDEIDAKMSSLIYRDFAQGKVITKRAYDTLRAEYKDNPQYTLLFNNESHFKKLYQHIGSELILDDSGEFYYIREMGDDGADEADENAFKIQVVLLILGRYFSRSGRDLELLSMPDMGLDEVDITALNDDPEYTDILRAARFKNGTQEALDFITSRNFAYKVGDKRYFLSDAGNTFLLRLLSVYEKNALE
tara:strand:+ start:16048 stop:16647 length:600 start_codon:yes stop_codon:yes gene_type:complete